MSDSTAPRFPESFSVLHGVREFMESIRQLASKSRFSVDGWFQDNVAASQTDVQLTRFAAGTKPNVWIAPRVGSVVAFWVKSNEARTAGTLTIELFKNGTQLGTEAITLNATQTIFNVNYVKAGVLPFKAADELDLRITTTGSWTPTTADIRAGMDIEY